jgi:chemotaxis protein methyltransferase CheR
MVLWQHFPPTAGWDLEIRATDLSTRALERARVAIWPLQKAKEIPPRYLTAFMLKGTGPQAGMMKAGPEIRSIVLFERLNLNDESYPSLGFFDLIFCRNVLIYFSPEARARVIERLLNHLAPTGYLFLGHAESLSSLTDRVRSVMPTVYVRAEELKPGAGTEQRGMR